MNMKWLRFFSVVMTMIGLSTVAFADAALQEAGRATRVKSVAFVDVNVYAALFQVMTEADGSFPTKASVMGGGNSMKLTMTALRDLPKEKVADSLKKGLGAQADQIIAKLPEEWKKGGVVSFNYDATSKVTTFSTPSGSVTVAGQAFASAWITMYVNADQKGFGGSLTSKLK